MGRASRGAHLRGRHRRLHLLPSGRRGRHAGHLLRRGRHDHHDPAPRRPAHDDPPGAQRDPVEGHRDDRGSVQHERDLGPRAADPDAARRPARVGDEPLVRLHPAGSGRGVGGHQPAQHRWRAPVRGAHRTADGPGVLPGREHRSVAGPSRLRRSPLARRLVHPARHGAGGQGRDLPGRRDRQRRVGGEPGCLDAGRPRGGGDLRRHRAHPGPDHGVQRHPHRSAALRAGPPGRLGRLVGHRQRERPVGRAAPGCHPGHRW